LIKSFAFLCLPILRAITLGFSVVASASWSQTQGPIQAEETGGPIRLRQITQPAGNGPSPTADTRITIAYAPSEFELFVQSAAGAPVRRLGADLVTESVDLRTADLSPLVPDDYILAPGDEVLITIWGSLDAELRLVVDKRGRIAVPRVGVIQVAGVRHADLAVTIERRVAQVFRGFQLSATVGQLRGVRVFVTGFVQQPGTYTVSSLSTVITALMKAGGPSASGSFRRIELRRDSRLVTPIDLYDLLLKGDRTADHLLQGGDVVHVGPVGVQVGVIGSVNKAVVAELKAGETVADALTMAGGFSALADRQRVLLERLSDRNSIRSAELEMPRDASAVLAQGDLLRVLNATSAVLSTQFQNKRVSVEGEVARPGVYLLPAGSTLQDALKSAGGLTQQANLFGTDFVRERVRVQQQENYERALRDLETEFTRNSASQRVVSAEDAAVQSSRALGSARLIERLRALKPTGRVVLQLEPDAQSLPSLTVEDGDRIVVPPRLHTAGVFGSVFNAGTFLLKAGLSIGDVIHLAGGTTRGADVRSSFVVRANGSVVSAQQASTGWFGTGGGLHRAPALPGDTVFVPEELSKTTFMQEAKDWATILAQFGLGAAAIKTLRN
jgi:protein involved in polysaccharide export with SLBB domain